ncbi:MAG: hypothetical protein J7J72_03425 [Bacteroidales bacterium]|nr:hypothetical protein [Bacteroidales bacterium]
MDRVITSLDYNDMKERVDKELVLAKDKLAGLMNQSSSFKTYIDKELPMLENLVEYYRESDGATKKKILGCIFSEKLILEKGKHATPIFTEPIQSIINISRALGDSKKRKRSKMTSCLV